MADSGPVTHRSGAGSLVGSERSLPGSTPSPQDSGSCGATSVQQGAAWHQVQPGPGVFPFPQKSCRQEREAEGCRKTLHPGVGGRAPNFSPAELCGFTAFELKTKRRNPCVRLTVRATPGSSQPLWTGQSLVNRDWCGLASAHCYPLGWHCSLPLRAALSVAVGIKSCQALNRAL